jgi:hypothetical protein
MELRHFRYFVAAAEEGHISRPQRSGIFPHALGIQIRELRPREGRPGRDQGWRELGESAVFSQRKNNLLDVVCEPSLFSILGEEAEA